MQLAPKRVMQDGVDTQTHSPLDWAKAREIERKLNAQQAAGHGRTSRAIRVMRNVPRGRGFTRRCSG